MMGFIGIPNGFWTRIVNHATDGCERAADDVDRQFREIDTVRLSVEHRGLIAGLTRNRSSFLD
jgi:hypothetical protein